MIVSPDYPLIQQSRLNEQGSFKVAGVAYLPKCITREETPHLGYLSALAGGEPPDGGVVKYCLGALVHSTMLKPEGS